MFDEVLPKISVLHTPQRKYILLNLLLDIFVALSCQSRGEETAFKNVLPVQGLENVFAKT